MGKLLALDWGTSSFRAYLLDENGAVVHTTHSDTGILTVEPGDFSRTLHRNLKDIVGIERDTPIIAAGMITSRQGWLETEYVECPAGAAALACRLASLDDTLHGRIWFVPGVKQLRPTSDIMRGEETQLAGISSTGLRIVLLPGTHSKWVRLNGDTIEGFTTFMTGDLFNAVKNNTILRTVSKNTWRQDDFQSGVHDGFSHMKAGKSLLTSLFQTRVATILGLSPNTGSESYLSGLFIGTEIAEAISAGYHSSEPLLILGNDRLSKLYITALNICDLTGEPAPADSAALGLYRIASLAGII